MTCTRRGNFLRYYEYVVLLWGDATYHQTKAFFERALPRCNISSRDIHSTLQCIHPSIFLENRAPILYEIKKFAISLNTSTFLLKGVLFFFFFFRCWKVQVLALASHRAMLKLKLIQRRLCIGASFAFDYSYAVFQSLKNYFLSDVNQRILICNDEGFSCCACESFAGISSWLVLLSYTNATNYFLGIYSTSSI